MSEATMESDNGTSEPYATSDIVDQLRYGVPTDSQRLQARAAREIIRLRATHPATPWLLVQRLADCNPQPSTDDEWCYFCGEFGWKTDGQRTWREDHATGCLWVDARRVIAQAMPSA